MLQTKTIILYLICRSSDSCRPVLSFYSNSYFHSYFTLHRNYFFLVNQHAQYCHIFILNGIMVCLTIYITITLLNYDCFSMRILFFSLNMKENSYFPVVRLNSFRSFDLMSTLSAVWTFQINDIVQLDCLLSFFTRLFYAITRIRIESYNHMHSHRPHHWSTS